MKLTKEQTVYMNYNDTIKFIVDWLEARKAHWTEERNKIDIVEALKDNNKITNVFLLSAIEYENRIEEVKDIIKALKENK
jgi:hypothetical protein